MTQRRVAVTGLGIISALGHNLAEVWEAMRTGRPAISAIASVDTSSLRFKNGAEVRNYDPAQHFDSGQVVLLDRFAQFAVIAARQALADATDERASVLDGLERLGGGRVGP